MRDFELEFPHGKRNKIILVARELDRLIEDKLGEVEKQKDIAKRLDDIKKL